jgi:hypothetical protein
MRSGRASARAPSWRRAGTRARARRDGLGHRLERGENRASGEAETRQPVDAVLGRAEHPVGEARQPSLLRPPAGDVVRGGIVPGLDAAVADRGRRLAAAWPVRYGQQVDARADRKPVVDGEVEGHVERPDQRAQIEPEVEPVLDMNTGDAQGAEQRQHVGEQGGVGGPGLRRAVRGLIGARAIGRVRGQPQRDEEFGVAANAGGADAHALPVHGRAQHEDVGDAMALFGESADILADAAVIGVLNGEDRGQATGREELQRGRDTIGPRLIQPDMDADMPPVVGPARLQGGDAGRALGRIVAEADLALMVDEEVAGEQMAPTGGIGAHTEVILFAVAAPESIGIENAELVERVSPHVHAEADGGGDGHRAAGIGGEAGGVDAG